MKIKFLIIIALCIFSFLIIFTTFVYLFNLELEFQRDYGGGSLDSNPDLSPSYAYDFAGRLLAFNSILVAGPIIFGSIALAFIIMNIILRKRNIPSRKYMLILAAGILITFGYSPMLNGLQAMILLEHLEEEKDWILFISGAIQLGIGTAFITPAIIILKKVGLKIRK